MGTLSIWRRSTRSSLRSAHPRPRARPGSSASCTRRTSSRSSDASRRSPYAALVARTHQSP